MRNLIMACLLGLTAGAGASWAILSVRMNVRVNNCAPPAMSGEEQRFLGGHQVPLSGYKSF
jgi:hypothetical protein